MELHFIFLCKFDGICSNGIKVNIKMKEVQGISDELEGWK